MNYTHVDLEIKFSEYRDSDSEYRLKEWGIRLLKDRGGNDVVKKRRIKEDWDVKHSALTQQSTIYAS